MKNVNNFQIANVQPPGVVLLNIYLTFCQSQPKSVAYKKACIRCTIEGQIPIIRNSHLRVRPSANYWVLILVYTILGPRSCDFK